MTLNSLNKIIILSFILQSTLVNIQIRINTKHLLPVLRDDVTDKREEILRLRKQVYSQTTEVAKLYKVRKDVRGFSFSEKSNKEISHPIITISYDCHPIRSLFPNTLL